jgi:branched-chain amino acid transport system substrate-binding protein
MRSMTFLAKLALAASLLAFSLAGFALAQEAPAADPAASPPAAPEAKPVRKPAKPAPPAKQPPKPGEVLPMDQPATGSGEPAPAPQGKPAKPAKGGDASAKPGKGSPLPMQARAGAGNLTVGALLPVTGSLAAQGQSSRAALELAVSDINAYFSENGSPDRVTLQIEDTASLPGTALARLKALAAAGVRVVIGPYSDNEVDAVLDFANKEGIILISQGSAGPYLSKPDNLLRLSPSDAFQAEALAVLANQEGATHLIAIWEGDMYGDELVTHIKGQFANQGGQVVAGTRFRPEVNQFASYVADLKAQIDKQVKDKKKLAIVVAARGTQTAGILREAAKLSGLDEARWYGTDDAALRGNIIQDQNVAKFAAKVRMAFARYGETGTAQYTDLEKRIEERIQAFVDTQAVTAYDAVWLTAFAGLASADASALRKAIQATAERLYGASGWLALSENGDRREDYDFDFWTISLVDGKYYWVKTARYQFDPGSVKQLIINAPEKE